MVTELIAGGSAGAIGIVIGSPLDVIKVRMQTMPDKYRDIQQSIRSILKDEGLFTFYRGMSSPLLAQFVLNSVLFTTNAVVMSILEPRRKVILIFTFR